MKKVLYIILAVSIALCSVLTACNDTSSNNSSNSTPTPQIFQPSNTKIFYTYKELDRYEYFKFPIETDGTVEWLSSDTDIASVDSEGVVLALDMGNTIITARVSGQDFNCKVTVGDKGYLPVICLDLINSQVDLAVGCNYTVKPYVLYNDISYEDGEFTYETADSSIVAVNSNGTITAVKKGETILRVYATWHECTEIPVYEISVIVGD
jgi:hypothetical protein